MRRKYLEELNSAREGLKERLLEAFVANRKIYGAPRLTHELRDSGINVSRSTYKSPDGRAFHQWGLRKGKDDHDSTR